MIKRKKSKILVTGVAGFIGSSIAKKLKNRFEIIGIDDLSIGNIKNIPKEVKFYKIDISKKGCLDKFQKVEYVMHLAGQSSGDKSFNDPIADLKKNTHSTLNLLKYGIKNKVKKIIYASSMSVYGKQSKIRVSESNKLNPTSYYGVSKISSEEYIKLSKSKLNYIIFRMFNVYGPGQKLEDLNQGMVSIYLSQFLSKKYILVKGSLNRVRDFIYIDDVVDIWTKSLNKKYQNQTFNLGTGVGTSVKKLINLISKNAKIKLTKSTRGDQSKIISNTKKLRMYFKKKNFIRLAQGLKNFIEYENKKIEKYL